MKCFDEKFEDTKGVIGSRHEVIVICNCNQL